MTDNYHGFNPYLPGNIREDFIQLCQDVAFLRTRWNFYLELFTIKENAALISELAPASFQIIEEAVRYEITQVICRLSDPPENQDDDNGSFISFSRLLGDLGFPIELLDKLIEACQPFREYRNHRLDHNDLDEKIEPRNSPLLKIGRATIEHIIQTAEEILNLVFHQFDNEALLLKIRHRGDAGELILWLEKAKEADTIRRRDTLMKAD